jgi:HAE1 family hydrophobic/amphiphilic exporter-1/multidrug efflux pump
MVCAQQQRHHGSVQRVLYLALDHGLAPPGALQRRALGRNPGHGLAGRLVERHAAELPAGIGFEWTGVSRQEREAGGQAMLLYAVSILVVFLCLAALYESWSIPFSVLLVVPLGVLGTLAAAALTWKMNDVYFQVGLLTTVGLASKNAILIVEFAKDLYAKGMPLVEAAITAARMRLRPILMTSLAFILGVLPLMLSKGAGAGAQNALGTAVVGGMVTGTVLAIFFVPLFFVIVQKLFGRKKPASGADVHAATPVLSEGH